MATASLLARHPRLVRWGARLDTAPDWIWLALFAAALWPAWHWMARRMLDHSDDPLGLLALGALAALVVTQRRRLRAVPRTGWLACALALATTATVLLAADLLPPLAGALVAVLAVAAALAAWLPYGLPTLPVLGLAVLALPLLASLQFYAGFPLRVIAAEASRWLLSPFFTVERMGSSLRVDGLLVIVDAPCSGVQMAWLGYFTACAVALHARLGDRAFIARLPLVGALVLLANVLRNTVLVAAAGAGHALPGWAHEAVGLLTLAPLCAAIALLMHRRAAR
ncbi:MAG: exosortase Q [Burkholderiaceae bacterium]|nr:exosortase Q [Burkholderiaceae bacterium]